MFPSSMLSMTFCLFLLGIHAAKFDLALEMGKVSPASLSISTVDTVIVRVDARLSNCAPDGQGASFEFGENSLYFNRPGRLLLYTSCPPPNGAQPAAVINVSQGESCKSADEKVDHFGTPQVRDCTAPLVIVPKVLLGFGRLNIEDNFTDKPSPAPSPSPPPTSTSSSSPPTSSTSPASTRTTPSTSKPTPINGGKNGSPGSEFGIPEISPSDQSPPPAKNDQDERDKVSRLKSSENSHYRPGVDLTVVIAGVMCLLFQH